MAEIHEKIIRDGNHFIRLDGSIGEPKWMWFLIDGPWFDRLNNLAGNHYECLVACWDPREQEITSYPSIFVEGRRSLWLKRRWSTSYQSKVAKCVYFLPQFPGLPIPKQARDFDGWMLQDGRLPYSMDGAPIEWAIERLQREGVDVDTKGSMKW